MTMKPGHRQVEAAEDHHERLAERGEARAARRASSIDLTLSHCAEALDGGRAVDEQHDQRDCRTGAALERQRGSTAAAWQVRVTVVSSCRRLALRGRRGLQPRADDDADDEQAAVDDLVPASLETSSAPTAASASGRCSTRRASMPSSPPRPPPSGVPPSATAASAISVYCGEAGGLRRQHERGQRDRRPTAANRPAERVGDDAHGGDVDAGAEGGRVVAADRVEVAVKAPCATAPARSTSGIADEDQRRRGPGRPGRRGR